MIRLAFRGVSEAVQILDRKAEQVDRNLDEAARRATELVERETADRVLIPRRLNVQDDARPRQLTGRKPVRKKVVGHRGQVELLSHWTNVRTSGLIRQFQARGLTRLIERKGLWVRRDSWTKDARGRFTGRAGAPKRGYSGREGLVRMTFRRHPELNEWAQRADRGYQFFRHAVRLRDPSSRRTLILGPAVESKRQEVLRIYRDAATRGLLG